MRRVVTAIGVVVVLCACELVWIWAVREFAGECRLVDLALVLSALMVGLAAAAAGRCVIR